MGGKNPRKKMKKETIGIEPETLEELATPLTRHKLRRKESP